LKICLFVLLEFTNVTDGQTDRHRMTALAALVHSIARQKNGTEDAAMVSLSEGSNSRGRQRTDRERGA